MAVSQISLQFMLQILLIVQPWVSVNVLHSFRGLLWDVNVLFSNRIYDPYWLSMTQSFQFAIPFEEMVPGYQDHESKVCQPLIVSCAFRWCCPCLHFDVIDMITLLEDEAPDNMRLLVQKPACFEVQGIHPRGYLPDVNRWYNIICPNLVCESTWKITRTCHSDQSVQCLSLLWWDYFAVVANAAYKFWLFHSFYTFKILQWQCSHGNSFLQFTAKATIVIKICNQCKISPPQSVLQAFPSWNRNNYLSNSIQTLSHFTWDSEATINLVTPRNVSLCVSSATGWPCS